MASLTKFQVFCKKRLLTPMLAKLDLVSSFVALSNTKIYFKRLIINI